MPVLNFIRGVERKLISALMILMPLAYCFNVGVRFLAPSLASNFAWIEELVLFGLAWLVFAGLGLALERGRHIAMTALFNRLSGTKKRWIGVLINLVGLTFCVFIAKAGIDLTLFVMRSGQISPTLDVSMAWLYAPVPVGFSLLALRYLLELLRRDNRFNAADRGREP